MVMPLSFEPFDGEDRGRVTAPGASPPPPGRAEVFSGAVLLQRYERYVRHAHANARGP